MHLVRTVSCVRATAATAKATQKGRTQRRVQVRSYANPVLEKIASEKIAAGAEDAMDFISANLQQLFPSKKLSLQLDEWWNKNKVAAKKKEVEVEMTITGEDGRLARSIFTGLVNSKVSLTKVGSDLKRIVANNKKNEDFDTVVLCTVASDKVKFEELQKRQELFKTLAPETVKHVIQPLIDAASMSVMIKISEALLQAFQVHSGIIDVQLIVAKPIEDDILNFYKKTVAQELKLAQDKLQLSVEYEEGLRGYKLRLPHGVTDYSQNNASRKHWMELLKARTPSEDAAQTKYNKELKELDTMMRSNQKELSATEVSAKWVELQQAFTKKVAAVAKLYRELEASGKRPQW